MRVWERGLRVIPLLVPRVAGIRAYGAIDATGLCEALRQTAEERFYGRGGDLRSGNATQHAGCPGQNGRAAERPDAASSAPSLYPPADGCHKLDTRLSCRVRDRRPGWAQG